MSDELGDEEAAILAELKELGRDKVRRLLASDQLPLAHREPALRWIEEIDRASAEESERREDASRAEQLEIDRSAKDAAWSAARAAEHATAAVVKKANIRATSRSFSPQFQSLPRSSAFGFMRDELLNALAAVD